MVNLQRHYRSDLVPPNGNTNPGWIENPELDAVRKKALETPNEEGAEADLLRCPAAGRRSGGLGVVVHQKGGRAWNKKVQGFVNPNSYMFTFKTVTGVGGRRRGVDLLPIPPRATVHSEPHAYLMSSIV